MEDELLTERELRKSIDSEVKRVADLFRFILKFKKHFQPSGVEFSGLRQYLPSDDASRIDWKNSAKTQDLYVDQFDEEIDMDVFIILDVSETMLFGTAEKLKSEYAAVVAAALAYASIDAGINVGFGMWGDNEVLVTPNGGQAQYQKVLMEVTKQDNYGGQFHLQNALQDVIGQIKQNTAIFVVSDFINPRGEWEKEVKLASKKFRHIMGVMVRDLRDYQLPKDGNLRLEDPDSDEQMVVNTDRIKDDFEEKVEKQEENVENAFTKGGGSFLKIDTRDSFAANFAAYFDEEGSKW